MKKSIISLLVFFGIAGATTAQTVTVADVEALPGETVTATLNLSAPANTYTGTQFALQFPAMGFSLAASGAATGWPGSLEYGTMTAGKVRFAAAASSTFETAAIKVTFTVDAAVEVNEYDVTVTDIMFEGPSGKDPVSDVTFKVKVVSVHTVVLDETSETAPAASDGAVNVRVLRTIKANEWSTICLPFAMSAEQIETAFGSDVMVELGDADSYETTEDDDDNIVGITINFNNVSPLAIQANHPYIIKVSSAITSFDVDGVVVSPATTVSGRRKKIGNRSYFIGNYENQAEVPEFGLFLSGNKFWYSTGDTKMKAFRSYFDLNDVLTEVDEAAARISFNFDDATGISEASLFENEKMRNGENEKRGRVYDLQGRRIQISNFKLQTSKLKQGIYIVNGKKVVK